MKPFYKFFSFLFVANFLFAQPLELSGDLVPGNLVIGFAPGALTVYLDEKELFLEQEGFFIFGFDRDASGTHYLKVKYKEGKAEIKKIDLPAREYQIQKINNMKSKYVTPPEEELDRIAEEREIITIKENSIGLDKNAYYKSGFTRPVKGGRISGVFGSQRILNGVPKSPHNGLDIAAPMGTPVYSMSDGVVVFVGTNYYYRGNFILIDHGQGLYSRYFHLSKTDVKEDDRVKKGDKIGEVGSTGRSTGAHLHWSVQWYNKRIDPACILNLSIKPEEN